MMAVVTGTMVEARRNQNKLEIKTGFSWVWSSVKRV